MEMFILYDRLDDILKKRNIKAHRPLIANVITTQEMAGFSLSLCKADAAIKKLWTRRRTPLLQMPRRPRMSEKTITKNDIIELIRRVSDKIVENRDYLSKLDTEIGDGDHGVGLAAGSRASPTRSPSSGPWTSGGS